MAKLLSKLILLMILGIGAYYQNSGKHQRITPHKVQSPSLSDSGGLTDPDLLHQAFDAQQSNLQVKQSGRVIKLLKDDRQGPRHQRFVVQLASGQQLLIAHNTDLAPKIEDLRTGDVVTFYGEYEWNNKGGVVHWTHHDPQRRHLDGWLVHNNKKYQ